MCISFFTTFFWLLAHRSFYYYYWRSWLRRRFRRMIRSDWAWLLTSQCSTTRFSTNVIKLVAWRTKYICFFSHLISLLFYENLWYIIKRFTYVTKIVVWMIKAFEDGIAESDSVAGDESNKESHMILGLLRDNLSTWTSDS